MLESVSNNVYIIQYKEPIFNIDEKITVVSGSRNILGINVIRHLFHDVTSFAGVIVETIKC